MNNVCAKKTLIDVITVLDNNDIFVWLVSGTLLGFVRDGGFISYDTDIDIAIDVNDFKRYDIMKILTENGFRCHQSIDLITPNVNGCEYTFYKNGIRVDVFGYETNDTTICTYAYVPKRGQTWMGNLQPILFTWDKHEFETINPFCDDFKCNIPSNSEYWLETIYGKSWKSPTDSWVYERDSKNMIVNDSLTAKLVYYT